jgi:putative ABC transport system permease protein
MQMTAISLEIRLALRRLLRTPVFTCAAIVSLALGIAATTAIYSMVHAVLIEPLPYPDSNRLVGVWHMDADDPKWGQADISYVFYRQNNHVFEDMGIFRRGSVNLAGSETPEELPVTLISASVLGVLGASPQIGRGFVEGEERPGVNRP